MFPIPASLTSFPARNPKAENRQPNWLMFKWCDNVPETLRRQACRERSSTTIGRMLEVSPIVHAHVYDRLAKFYGALDDNPTVVTSNGVLCMNSMWSREQKSLPTCQWTPPGSRLQSWVNNRSTPKTLPSYLHKSTRATRGKS